MSIVDTYDALTTERPHRTAVTSEQACGELRAEAGRGWKNTRLVEEFVSMVPRLTSKRSFTSPGNGLKFVE
jgi:response regulator RpfG family c-di-GMP phosphodiesterase